MNAITDKLPPHAYEAECGALGCILQDNGNAKAMVAELHRSDFFDLRHSSIFSAIQRLVCAGQAPDTVTICQALSDRKELERAGGLPYVAGLPDAAPSPANFPSYVEILQDKAWRRRLLEASDRANKLAYDEGTDAARATREFADFAECIFSTGKDSREWFKFYSPGECREYDPPAGMVLVGDGHLVRGSVTVIAGPAGVGKSRGSNSLAVAGATLKDWFGLTVHRRFKTAILQGENGRHRLKTEFAELSDPVLNEYIRVSDRPPFGLAFDNADFRRGLAEFLAEFKPDVIILDPWNGITRDDGQRDYREAFEHISSVLPHGDDAPAIVIVAHTRKPKSDDRKTGRALLNELSGSHALGSVPRCVFVMQAASDDETDDRVVWTCCKNNDGELGGRSAWHRRNGLFVPCAEFDWQAFDNPVSESIGTITKGDLDKLFANGKRQVARKHAVKELMDQTGFGHSACYNALKLDGRFKQHLSEKDGLLVWTP